MQDLKTTSGSDSSFQSLHDLVFSVVNWDDNATLLQGWMRGLNVIVHIELLDQCLAPLFRYFSFLHHPSTPCVQTGPCSSLPSSD